MAVLFYFVLAKKLVAPIPATLKSTSAVSHSSKFGTVIEVVNTAVIKDSLPETHVPQILKVQLDGDAATLFAVSTLGVTNRDRVTIGTLSHTSSDQTMYINIVLSKL